jgi:probable phosphoglycerate mutase
LTEQGRDESRLLGQQIRHVRIELCVHTRFGRTRETAEVALEGRDVPLEVEPLLDDIDVGELEGVTLDEYRAWKREHIRSDDFPGGESLDAAARRYAEAYRKLLERPERSILVVAHEIPLRYAINAAGGSDDLDGPTRQLANATPYLFDQDALSRAAEGILRLA